MLWQSSKCCGRMETPTGSLINKFLAMSEVNQLHNTPNKVKESSICEFSTVS